MTKKEIESDIAEFKALLNDASVPADEKELAKEAIIELEEDLKKLNDKPAKKKQAKPAKPKTTVKAAKNVDPECDDLLEQYKKRKARSKASSKKSASTSDVQKAKNAAEKNTSRIIKKYKAGDLTSDQIKAIIKELKEDISELEKLLKTKGSASPAKVHKMSDGFEFKIVSSDYASKNWNNEEIFGLDGDTESLIESKEDLSRFDKFGTELKKKVAESSDRKESNLLKSKGYSKLGEMVYGDELSENSFQATQGEKGIGVGKLEFGIAYIYQNEESGVMQINQTLMDWLADAFSNFPVTIYTNAGVDLHSSKKGKYKNLTFEKINFNNSATAAENKTYIVTYDFTKYKPKSASVKKEQEEFKEEIVAKNVDAVKAILKDSHNLNPFYLKIEEKMEHGGSTCGCGGKLRKLEHKEGGAVEEIDYFEQYDKIPSNVREILDKYNWGEDGDYKTLEKMQKAVNQVGWDFDYYLDGVPFDLKKMDKAQKGMWIQRATERMKQKGTEGAFTAQAKRAGMKPIAFAKKIIANPDDYDIKTVRRAQFVKNANPEMFGGGGIVSLDPQQKKAIRSIVFNSDEDVPTIERNLKEKYSGKNYDLAHTYAMSMFKGGGRVQGTKKATPFNLKEGSKYAVYRLLKSKGGNGFPAVYKGKKSGKHQFTLSEGDVWEYSDKDLAEGWVMEMPKAGWKHKRKK